MGNLGYTGSVGNIGYTGSRGDVGYDGSRGYYGSFGYDGSKGDTGYFGSKGYDGSRGYFGSFGYTGSAGTNGYFGSVGLTGSAGGTGGLGYTGSKGDTPALASGYVAYGNGSAIIGSSNLTFDGTNLTCQGNVTAYSDERVKENIVTISDALAKVNSMRGVYYTTVPGGIAGTGVVAQEVQQILPEVIVVNPDGMLSVAYGNIVGVLIEAIKELTAEVEKLKKLIV
jgi:hypothetical protein